MILGVLRVELAVYESVSLKDKRRVVKSIKDRVSRRFNVSVAEVGHLDSRQQATLAMAMVSNATDHVHQAFDRIIELVRREHRASILSFDREMM